jgi:hypothetical protein
MWLADSGIFIRGQQGSASLSVIPQSIIDNWTDPWALSRDRTDYRIAMCSPAAHFHLRSRFCFHHRRPLKDEQILKRPDRMFSASETSRLWRGSAGKCGSEWFLRDRSQQRLQATLPQLQFSCNPRMHFSSMCNFCKGNA